jgi:hypothetical protein
VHERTVGKLLRRAGLTRLQPRPYHPKKDAEAQETFKNVWPAPSASDFAILPGQSTPTYPVSGHALAKMEIRASRSS